MSPPWSRTSGRRLGTIALVAGLVPGVGVLDFLSGQHATFSDFYMVPVALTTWYVSRRAGVVVAVCCVLSGIVADYFLPARVWHHLAVELWNAAAQLVIYGFTVWVLASLHDLLVSSEALVAQLEAALGEVRTLRGLLPICAWCKRIRDEKSHGEWKPVEHYVAQHTDAEFTHGICPECAAKLTIESAVQSDEALGREASSAE